MIRVHAKQITWQRGQNTAQTTFSKRPKNVYLNKTHFTR